MTKDEAFYFLTTCAGWRIEARCPRELEIAAAVDWEERLNETYLVCHYATYLARVMGPAGAAFHADHFLSEPCGGVDVAALREVLSRDYVWDRASGRFVADD
ncbi:MAG: hypothetical protein HY812_08040 [Planctomycetes bacterium]|nr:hypothetical protein [Planctomycetota bacterium]